MSASGLAVVVKLPALVDVEPVHANAQVKHGAPQLGQARAGIFLVQKIETRQGWTKEELNLKGHFFLQPPVRKVDLPFHSALPGTDQLNNCNRFGSICFRFIKEIPSRIAV